MGENFRRIAEEMGRRGGRTDAARWQVYQSALLQERLWATVVAALAEESDLSLQRAVAWELMEIVGEDLVEVVLDSVANDSTRRALIAHRHDVRLVKELVSTSDKDRTLAASPWAQREILLKSTDPDVLALLACEGKSRAIRGMATSRLQDLRRRDR